MDFSFTPQQEEFRNEVRAFVQAEVPPERRLVYGEDSDERHQFGVSIAKKLAERGCRGNTTTGWGYGTKKGCFHRGTIIIIIFNRRSAIGNGRNHFNRCSLYRTFLKKPCLVPHTRQPI